MAKNDDRRKGTNPEVPEVLPIATKKPETAALPDAEKQHDANEAAVEQAAARERADISLETLEKRASADNTEQLINSIKALESPEKQRANIDALLDVSTMLLAIAGHSDTNAIKEFYNFENIPLLRLRLPKSLEFKRAESAALRKLGELRDNLLSPTSKYVQEKRWGSVIGNAKRIAAQMNSLQNPNDRTDGFIDTAKKIVHKHPLLTGVALFGGALGLYKLYRFFSPSKPTESSSGGEQKTEENKGGILKWIVGFGIGIGSIFGLGRVLGMDGAKKWLKDTFKWNVDESRIAQTLILISKGELKKAAEMLWEGADENADFHKKMAEVISKTMGKEVTAKTLFELKDEKFEDFISTADSLWDMAEEKASSAIGDTGVKGTLARFLLGSAKEVQEKRALRAFLSRHETDIRARMKVTSDTKIEDVLQKLSENPTVMEGNPITPEKEDVDIAAAVETGLGEIAAVGKETLHDLKEEFRDKPAFQALLKDYEGRWENIFIHPCIFIGRFLSALLKDGIVAAIGGGSILMWNGYKFVTFTSVALLADTAWELVRHPLDSGPAVCEYIQDSIPFMVIGAGFMGSRGLATGGLRGALKGALQGAGHGFLFPVEVGRLHVAAGQHLYRSVRGKYYDIKVWKGVAEAVPQIRADQATFFAKTAAAYDELLAAADTPGRNLVAKKWWGKYTRARALRLREEYLRRFVRAHNELQEALKAQGRPYEVAIAEKEVLEESAMKKMRKFLETHDTAGSVNAIMLDKEPEFVKTEGSGADSKHTYKFNKDTFVLTESEIAEKAAEIDRAHPERAAAANRQEATRILVEEKYLTPTPVEGKPNTYKFQSREFTVTPAEIQARVAAGATEADAIRDLCYEKVLAHVTVEDVKIVRGKYQYKVGGQWMEPLDSPAKLAEVKGKFTVELQKKGISLDFQKFASESKVLSYFPVLEKVIGTSAAVLMIYHLETATDKRKAIAETAAGFGSFWAGMKLTDWKIGSKIRPTDPRKVVARTVIDIMGGLAVAFKFTEPIGEIVEHFYARIPGSYGVSEELTDIFEKATTRSTVRILAASAEKGILKKVVVKTGMEGISEIFERKITSTFMKKVGQMAAKQGFKQVLKMLGWKGVTAAALLADDATVIGVVDDIVALGLTVWMAFDIYDIVKLIANTVKVQEEMSKRNGVQITAFKIRDPKSRAAMQEKLVPFGLTVDRAHELGEQQLFDMLRTIPETAVEITRNGIEGKEVWYLKNAEAIGITILDDSGNEVAKISDGDAVKLDEALSKIEKEEDGQQKKAA